MKYMLCLLYLIISLFIVKNSALSCYTCNNCDNYDTSEKVCTSYENTCLKAVVGEHVMKSCFRKEVCNIRDYEKTLNNMWASFSSFFSGDSSKVREETVIHCCDTHLCNASNPLQLHYGIILAMTAVLFANI